LGGFLRTSMEDLQGFPLKVRVMAAKSSGMAISEVKRKNRFNLWFLGDKILDHFRVFGGVSLLTFLGSAGELEEEEKRGV